MYELMMLDINETHAEKLYMDIGAYWKACIDKFVSSYNGSILLFGLPENLDVLKILSKDERASFEKITHSPLEILSLTQPDREKVYWGDAYSEGISKKFVHEFRNLEYEIQNGVIRFKNQKENHYFTFQDGLRLVPNGKRASKKIYLIGPCTVFGSYVVETQTIEYYLQEKINNCKQNYQVLNCGFLGSGRDFQYLLTDSVGQNDVVVFLTFEHTLVDALKSYKQVHYLGNLSDIYSELEDPLSCILDNFRHVNYRVNQLIAERVYSALLPYLDSKKANGKENVPPIQNYFISWEIFEYYKKFAMKYQVG